MSELTPATLAPVGVHTPQTPIPGGDLLMAMSAASVRARVQSIQQVMEAVMKKGTHYDVIPGTERKDKEGKDISKPTLLKPGAEVLCMTFGLAPRLSIQVTGDHPDIAYRWKDRKKSWFDGARGREFKWEEEAGETLGYFEVVATCEIIGPDGRLLASATGSCNNREKKYRTLNVYEVRNTVMKMAGKRAFVAATLLATAASDCFSQDLEDDTDADQAGAAGNQSKDGQKKGGSEDAKGWMSAAQIKLLYAKGKKAGYEEPVIHHLQHSLNTMDRAKAKPMFDSIADEKPEAKEKLWERAKKVVEEAAQNGGEAPKDGDPGPDAPSGAQQDGAE